MASPSLEATPAIPARVQQTLVTFSIQMYRHFPLNETRHSHTLMRGPSWTDHHPHWLVPFKPPPPGTSASVCVCRCTGRAKINETVIHRQTFSRRSLSLVDTHTEPQWKRSSSSHLSPESSELLNWITLWLTYFFFFGFFGGLPWETWGAGRPKGPIMTMIAGVPHLMMMLWVATHTDPYGASCFSAQLATFLHFSVDMCVA